MISEYAFPRAYYCIDDEIMAEKETVHVCIIDLIHSFIPCSYRNIVGTENSQMPSLNESLLEDIMTSFEAEST